MKTSSIKNEIHRYLLDKTVQDLCTENYKTLLREIIEDPNNWKDMQCSWITRLNII